MIALKYLDGFFWLFLSIFVCTEGIKSRVGSFQSPGPGFLPFWAGTILCTLSVILIIKNIFQKRGEETFNWKGIEWGKVLIVLVSLFIYAAFLSMAGYLIATFGLMILLFCVEERPRIWVLGLSALITALATYVIFYVWLSVQLPRGILGL